MIYTCRPVKMAIYVAKGKKTIDQIKNETGADVIINGGLYELKHPEIAYCPLIVNGENISGDTDNYYGYGWHDDAADIRLCFGTGGFDNYIACDCMIRNGQKETLHVSADRSYSCPRTAIGIFPDGRVWFYAEPTKLTPAELQELAHGLGLDSAIMLDSGGSTQGISPTGSYKQSRKCHNYILAWLTEACPYAEPTEEVGRPKPSWVKWIQWHLVRHGFDLEVNGVFDNATHEAAVEFMSRYPNITPDGIVGRLTRAKLKEYPQTDELAPLTASEIIKPAYTWHGTLFSRVMTDFIVLHHAAGKASVMSMHQSHINNGWSGIGYHFYVRQDGTIYEGRPIDKVGAHCVPQNCNKRSVGICFEGNFETETMSEAQLRAGKRLVRYVKSIYPSAIVKKHKDFDATACPGKNFPFAEIGG